MIVVDASVVVQAALSRDGLEPLEQLEPVAPPLLWSEAPSALHEMSWRKTLSPELAALALDRFLGASLRRHRQEGLVPLAWEIASQLGWAKTYDAEYVATARALGCPLLTIDVRLKRGAGRMVEVLGPTEV